MGDMGDMRGQEAREDCNADDAQRELSDQLTQALERMIIREGDDNRLVLQGDRGYISVRSGQGEEEAQISLASGRSLDRSLTEEEAQRLYDRGFRRKSAAHPFTRVDSVVNEGRRASLSDELIEIAQDLYLTAVSAARLHTRFGDRPELNGARLVDAMRRLSKQRDMSSRQKVYWAVIRADVLLALQEPPPESLTRERGRAQWVEVGLNQIKDISSSVSPRDFKELTGYRSLAIFSDPDALEHVDPRGTHWVRAPGRLVISLALEQGWDSLLINPYGAVGGEFYRNELSSIIEGLERMGW